VTQRYTIPTIRPAQARTAEPAGQAPVIDAVPSPPILPRATGELDRERINPRASVAPARIRARGTPSETPATEDKLRTLIFAREPNRAGWIEGELQRAPVTIQVARRVRTVVAALTKDPPPRPDLLIVDFDAISAGELFELHAVRHDGWTGRLIGIGNVPEELRVSLGIREVLNPPLARDQLLDCVAGTRHAVVTLACPILPPSSGGSRF
jgi:hypothetical protein